jgi:hypothetical protein
MRSVFSATIGWQHCYVALFGIGAAVTRRPLPHHRAYGSVHGGSRWLRRHVFEK